MFTLLTTIGLALPLAVAPAPSAVGDAVNELVAQAFPGDAPFSSRDKGSRERFLQVLESDLFLHAEVGPFDVYLLQGDGWADPNQAAEALERVAKGLQPTVPVMERSFHGEAGLIAGRRLPVVLTHSDRARGQHGFDRVVALLDWAESDYSGWKQGGNPIFDQSLLAGLNVRTWEVQVFNLAHKLATEMGTDFLDHGLGYYQLSHVVARVLRQGAWGMVPPWLAQGLSDELDIAAYGQAWVGGDWWQMQRPGWFRPGWSGFVPEGASPPPPVTGPPANLAVTVTKTGDSWQHRDNSVDRHWADLVADRKSEAPASFGFMAANESFLPRDRALARAAMHVLLEVAPPAGRDGLLDLLDRVPTQPPSGMFDADPITVVFNKALGGVPEVDALEAMSLEELLSAIGHEELTAKLRELGAEEMLRIPDHREQAEWLYHHPCERDTRLAIWNIILEAEYYQQLAEWEPLGKALDRGVDEVFKVSKRRPTKDRDRERAAKAFWKALDG